MYKTASRFLPLSLKSPNFAAVKFTTAYYYMSSFYNHLNYITMLPGHAQIITCPFCGTEKNIMSIMSGNTFHAELWSDNKRIAPMMPEVSYVQKCNHCGKYYIIGRQKAKFSTKDYSSELGYLTFPEMKEAFAQLAAESFLREGEETKVRMMLHHAYNDYYYRQAGSETISEEDKKLFHDNGLWLIDKVITDNVMKAEFYREIGEFELARQALSSAALQNDFLKQVAADVLERLDCNDCKVFKLRT